MYPMAVVGTASRHLVIYSLENQPHEFKVRLSILLFIIGFMFLFFIDTGEPIEISTSLC